MLPVSEVASATEFAAVMPFPASDDIASGRTSYPTTPNPLSIRFGTMAEPNTPRPMNPTSVLMAEPPNRN